MWDIALTIAIAVAVLWLSLRGIATKTRCEKMVTYTVGGIAVILIGIQAYRNQVQIAERRHESEVQMAEQAGLRGMLGDATSQIASLRAKIGKLEDAAETCPPSIKAEADHEMITVRDDPLGLSHDKIRSQIIAVRIVVEFGAIRWTDSGADPRTLDLLAVQPRTDIYLCRQSQMRAFRAVTASRFGEIANLQVIYYRRPS